MPDLVPVIVFIAITIWIVAPKYFRHRQEMMKEQAKTQPKNPEQDAEVKKLRERVENLESLLCRLDSEINVQLEKTIGAGKIITSSDPIGNSQTPTTFMNVASALEL